MRYEDRWGPRVALQMPFDREAQDALKHALPFPRAKFDKDRKVWSVIDDDEVIKTAFEILKEYGYDSTTWASTEEGVEAHHVTSPKVNPSSTYGCSVAIERDKVILNWPYIPDAELRDKVRLKVKSIPGRKFNMEEKHWTIPLAHAHTLFKELDGVYQPLADTIYQAPEIREYLDGALKRVALSQAAHITDGDVEADLRERLKKTLPEGKELYPFQYAGVAFAELTGGRCLIGDDMGVGKTIQAIAYASLHPEQWPVAIVCPANVKYNWFNELQTWLPHASCSVVKNGKDPVQHTDFVVINYDLLNKKLEELQAIGMKMCIIDESHYLKNSKAKRTQATLHLANLAESILCLSGTAITNRPIEFYTTLNLLQPAQFSNFFQFAQRYTNAYHNGYGWDFGGASNTDELNQRIRDFTIRRLKTEVLAELPPKTRSYIPVQLTTTEAKEYRQARLDWLRQYERYMSGGMPPGFVLNMLTDLRHVCGRIKVRAALDWLREYRYQTGKPVVIYTHHKDVMDMLCEDMDEEEPQFIYRRISGETPSEKRAENVDSFQRGELDVLACSTLAAKEGITLTAADTVLFIEREWVPGWEEQAEDRVLRIGQDSDSVHAIYLSCADTIDEHFDRVIEEKRSVVSAVLDGGDPEERAAIVSALLKKMQDLDGFPMYGDDFE